MKNKKIFFYEKCKKQHFFIFGRPGWEEIPSFSKKSFWGLTLALPLSRSCLCSHWGLNFHLHLGSIFWSQVISVCIYISFLFTIFMVMWSWWSKHVVIVVKVCDPGGQSMRPQTTGLCTWWPAHLLRPQSIQHIALSSHQTCCIDIAWYIVRNTFFEYMLKGNFIHKNMMEFK